MKPIKRWQHNVNSDLWITGTLNQMLELSGNLAPRLRSYTMWQHARITVTLPDKVPTRNANSVQEFHVRVQIHWKADVQKLPHAETVLETVDSNIWSAIHYLHMKGGGHVWLGKSRLVDAPMGV